uniref:Uncharacterized protein n=1 Tax=Grammatophora oceanica TaxID=210454 RepID=A0A7S1URH0_9STRA|mmetsp:Transcript_19038/g.28168  ORF Transcript_19038/g.28168 Transcript_19038/m.28168 type:complete len:171 (+) Transcript_19038:142-654(+)|eukprot:CAMPEP_0194047282 /NCGR_PEP_ID=MMETSP0009_2-20130614/23798_1 /TAXON_ID=210454 /ORGANISM="Grammatophora oceanica, Strain CCMP 410" /LENGTH=170 /DNA_ID=CAMNT_0038692839 /DNA_START=142 /DNA_END=654 /DNA_ORIENTATION=+
MPDVERQNLVGNNPYASMPDPTVLAPLHPLNLLKRGAIIGGSLWGLHSMKVWYTILHSPNVRHEWFKAGVGASIAILMIKAYVEMYAGKLKKQEVSYKTFPQTTHAVMFLLVLSSVAYNTALWPAYGWNSLIVMTMIGFGVVLQLALFLPTYAQNALGIIFMTFFLQQYK